jgi:hypothetical protein
VRSLPSHRIASDDNLMMLLAQRLNQLIDSSKGLSTDAAARLLASALKANGSGSIQLAAETLDATYLAAAESRISETVWSELSGVLPDGYFWGWDRCYRLRRGIADRFEKGQWPAADLTRIARDDAVFSPLATELGETWSGRQVLQEALSSIVDGPRREALLRQLDG